MSNVLIVAFAVAFLIALFEDPIEILTVFVPTKLVNAVISIGLSYLGLYLLEPASVVKMVIYSLSASFLARTGLHMSEKMAEYRWSSTRQVV